MRSLIITTSLLLFGFISAHIQAAETPAIPSTTLPDVVALDIEKVYVGAHIISQHFEQLQKEVTEATVGFRAEGEAITQLENQRRMTENGNPELPTLLKKIEIAKFTLKISQKEMQARINAKNANLIRISTNDIRKHLKTYCSEKNIKMVIPTINSPLRGRNSDELQLELLKINVYYAAPSHDITDDFIGWLNAKFARTVDSNTDIEVVE